jgi:DNA-directed RNA polymerase III subunit RPC11
MECRTCPYQYVIKKRYYERKVFKHVDTDDIIGGKDEWENAQKTKIGCPREGCKGDEAAYYSVQIRSADEPMTNFYQVSYDKLEVRGEDEGDERLIDWLVYDLS